MADSIVDFDDVSFSYGTQTEGSLKHINLKIEEGECIVLTGQSGCGKTTIMRLINGLIPHFFEGSLTGCVKILGKDTKTTSVGELGRNIASIFQNPRSQFFTTNTTAEAAFACENYGIERAEMIKGVENAFYDFDAKCLMNRDMFSLSSGEKQKIAIIAAKTLNPNIYVFDEPSANLDIHAIMQLQEMIKKLKEAGHTVIVSEHRLFYLKNLCDRCFIMSNGNIVKGLCKSDIENMNTADLTNYKLRTFNIEEIGLNRENKTEYERSDNIKLEIKKLSFSYNHSKKLLDNINITAYAGETIAIIGQNGEGKTTLGKIIAGLLKSAHGRFFLDGKQVKQKELYKSVYFVMQESDYQLYSDSVLSELYVSSGLSSKRNTQKIECIMKLLHIFAYKEKHPWALSGGQKQRVTIAAAMASNKSILIFDEPTSGLDYENMKAVSKAINILSRQGTVNFVISHDLEFLSRVATRAVFIANGTIGGSISLKNNRDFRTVKDFLLRNGVAK